MKESFKTHLKGFFIFSILTIFSTVILFTVLEGVCVLLGFPQGASKYIETIVLRENLSLRKPQGEVRIFAYGESTMHGSHYWPVSNPPIWLAAYLKDFLPDQKIRVVNFSRMGSGPEFAFESFRDTLAYRPDLALFYIGHNVFLFENSLEDIRAQKRTLSYPLKEGMRQSRFISAVYRFLIAARLKSKTLAPPEDSIEYRVIETSPVGYSPLHSADHPSSYSENISFFRSWVGQILERSKENGVPALFLKPVSNLKDFPPSLAAHLKTMSERELALWEGLYQSGQKLVQERKFEEALEIFDKAYALDPTHAGLSFQMAQIHLKKGDRARAEQLFEESRDQDAYICRAPSRVLEVLEKLKENSDLILFDTEKVLLPEIPEGILGEPMIEDNVHLSIRGQALVARALAREMADRGWIVPKSKWRFSNENSFEEMAKNLGVNKELLFSAHLKLVHYFGSRFENRVRFAKKAVRIFPADSRALRHLAWTYWLAGEKEKSLEVYRKLEKINAESLQEVFKHQPAVREAFVK